MMGKYRESENHAINIWFQSHKLCTFFTLVMDFLVVLLLSRAFYQALFLRKASNYNQLNVEKEDRMLHLFSNCNGWSVIISHFCTANHRDRYGRRSCRSLLMGCIFCSVFLIITACDPINCNRNSNFLQSLTQGPLRRRVWGAHFRDEFD